jgi:hypothetical protein
MNIINRTHLNDWIYHINYDFDYLERNLNAGNTKFVRDGDAWVALKLAFGILNLDQDPNDPIKNDPTFYNQVTYLQHNKQRDPKVIMEVGSGCGEVSISFFHMNCQVHTVDLNVSSCLFHQGNFGRFGFNRSPNENYNLYLGKVGAFLDCIPDDLDTLVMVESIEHIFPNEWEEFWSAVKPILEKNHGRLIITNTLWPLGGMTDPAREHVMRVDDPFYDNLIAQGGQVLHRNKANLCIQY